MRGFHATARRRGLLALLGASLAVPALALDLGEPVLHSAPGEPLDLTIPVLCGAEECEHFEAALGGSADYRAARVPEPHGQLGFGYDRALDAIRVRSATPLPAQTLHLLLDLHAGAASLRKDVVVALPGPPQVAEEAQPAATTAAPTEPAAAPAVSSAATTIPAVAASPAAPPVHAAAATPAPRQPQQEPGAQLLGLFRSLDPAQVATGLGIGAGLLLGYLLLRFLRAVFHNTVGRWVGAIRYRWAARQRERRSEDAAALMPAAVPLASGPRTGQPGLASNTPALREVKDELARRLRLQIEAEPERLDLKLKLAERLFALQDGEAYTDLALSLKPLLKEQAWERLRRMGQQLRPYDDRFLNLGDRGVADTVPLIKSSY